MTPAEAVRNAHVWFETNSGWAPPDPDTLAEWAADGVSRSPDECLVTPDGWCAHGLASWSLILDALAIDEAHRRAQAAGEPGYLDPTTGLFVMTADYLRARGTCCDSGCRHCPYRGP